MVRLLNRVAVLLLIASLVVVGCTGIDSITSGIRELSSKEMYDMYKSSGDSKEASTVYSKGYDNVEDVDTDDYVDDGSDA